MSRKIYKVKGIACEISPELNRELEKIDRRKKYNTYLDKKNNLLYFDALDSDDFSGSDIIVDTNTNVEEEVIKKLTLDKLKEILKTLADDELLLIETLIYQEKSNREAAKILGVSHTAVRKRWNKLREKIMKLMGS